MLFADDIVLIDKTKEGLIQNYSCGDKLWKFEGLDWANRRLSIWSVSLEKGRNNEQGVITLDGQKIPVTECFKYLGSVIQKDKEIDGDVNHRVKADWLK